MGFCLNYIFFTQGLPDTPKEHYRRIYTKSFDLIIECLKERFEQDGLKMYENLQDLLMLAAKGEAYDEKLTVILDFYKEDFDANCLRAQMKIFSTIFSKKENLTFGDIITYFKELGPGVKNLLSEVCKVMELVLVLPASNATPARNFLKLRTIKTYLRSKMSPKRLNHFMILGLYTDMVDKLDLTEIAEEFIKTNERREKVFGKAK